ncbi:sugar ABC transporter substrate-binding protein [Nocardioides limicola]|uniref:sugar ABC transporter substrate-binding protein n=1 Tax=Nocardioides limicola TaxID=2803368 RepID=UPI00193BC396|nr:substrate-binding domain-containing protein [Nocardioides sp. DJM-14]
MSIKQTGRRWLAAGAVGALVLTGCASRDSDSAGSDRTPVGETSELLTQPTELPVTDPVEGDIPADITVAYLYNGIDQSTSFLNGMKAAAAELGWTMHEFSYDPANPASFQSAVISAVESGPDAMVTNTLVQQQLDPVYELTSMAGIPLVAATSSAVADENLYPILTTQTNTAHAANLAAQQLVVDAGDTPIHVAQVTVPQFADTLGSMAAEVEKVVTGACDECSHDLVEVSLTDVFTGQHVGQVVSYLQANPEVNYLFADAAQISLGLDAQLQQAGLTQIQVYGALPSQAQLSAVKDGAPGAWATFPLEVMGWAMIDTVARAVTGDASNPWQDATLSYVVNASNVDAIDVANPVFPADYRDQFKELWGRN